jgi:hypothetical protein
MVLGHEPAHVGPGSPRRPPEGAQHPGVSVGQQFIQQAEALCLQSVPQTAFSLERRHLLNGLPDLSAVPHDAPPMP